MNSRSDNIVYVVFAACILLLPNLFVRGLWAPDEPRYAEIAREIHTSDNLVVLRLNGEVYPEKPPLFFYLAAAGDLLWSPNGGRLVSFASVVLIALLLQGFFRNTNTLSPIHASFVFLISLLTLVCGKHGIFDGLLVLFLVVEIYLGRKALSASRPFLWWMGSYAALALGVLVKGPVLIPFAILAIAGSLGTIRRAAPLSRHVIGNVCGLVACSGLVALWLVPACMAGGDAYTKALLGQIYGRISGERMSHNEPWHYYFSRSLFVFLPWMLILLCALNWAVRTGRQTRWLLFWFVGGFVLLSVVSSKRERYLFLILPAAALLITRYLDSCVPGKYDRLAMRITSGVLISACSLLIFFAPELYAVQFLFGDQLPERAQDFIKALSPLQLWLFSPVLGITGVYTGVISWTAVSDRFNPRHFITGVFLSTLTINTVVDLVAIPALDPIKTGQSFVNDVKVYAEKGTAVSLFRKNYDGRFNLYLKKDHLTVVHSEEQIPEVLDSNEPAVLIIGFRKNAEAAVNDFLEQLSGASILAAGPMGGRTMYLVGNEAAGQLPNFYVAKGGSNDRH